MYRCLHRKTGNVLKGREKICERQTSGALPQCRRMGSAIGSFTWPWQNCVAFPGFYKMDIIMSTLFIVRRTSFLKFSLNSKMLHKYKVFLNTKDVGSGIEGNEDG